MVIKFLVFFIAAFAVVFAEPGSRHLWYGYALPALFILSLAYVFWWQGFVVLILGLLSWHFMDTVSGNWFAAGILPLAFGACMVYFFWWLAVSVFSERGLTQLSRMRTMADITDEPIDADTKETEI